MELWDIYNKDKEKTGNVIDRYGNQRLKEGEYHYITQAVIVNSKGDMLISKRSKTKAKFPLMWEFGGGSVKIGENTLDAVVREMKEELGIKLNKEEAIFLKTIRNDKYKYFKDMWMFRKDIKIKDLNFTDNEVIDAKWVTIEEFENMCKNNEMTPIIEFDRNDYKIIETLIYKKT